MPILDFIITVFCLIDDEYNMIDKPLRQRGFELIYQIVRSLLWK